MLVLFLDSIFRKFSIEAFSSAPTSTLWGSIWIAGFIATILVLLGLPVLYLRQAARAEGVGFIGVLLTTPGFLFSMIAAPIFFTVALPYSGVLLD